MEVGFVITNFTGEVGHPDRPTDRPGSCEYHHTVVAKRQNWWAGNAIACTSLVETFHFRKQFLPRNLAEPVADARLCCARAPAHRNVAPRRPRSEFFTWQRRRCPKGVRASVSEVKDGGGCDHPLTHGPVFQRDKRIIERLGPGFGDSAPRKCHPEAAAPETRSRPLPFSN